MYVVVTQVTVSESKTTYKKSLIHVHIQVSFKGTPGYVYTVCITQSCRARAQILEQKFGTTEDSDENQRNKTKIHVHGELGTQRHVRVEILDGGIGLGRGVLTNL